MEDLNKKKSLNLRRRIAPRTPSKRPCLIWENINPDIKKRGIILDLNMYGIRVRTSGIYEIGQELHIQMMKNEEYSQYLGVPIAATIVRSSMVDDNFIDYGMKRTLSEIKKTDRRGGISVPSQNNISKKNEHIRHYYKRKKQIDGDLI